MGDKKEKKIAYRNHMLELLSEYKKVLVVKADNVSSNQFHQLRKELRGKAVILMGKNTQQRKTIQIAAKKNAKLRALVDCLRSNVGLVFTHDDLLSVRDVLLANVVGAPAKVGAFAPCEVIVPAGNTGLEPGMTSFFQALNIPTKITKGTVEIQTDVSILKVGDRVGSSEATLLGKLNIKPFTYGLKCTQIYDDGSVYDAALLDVGADEVAAAVGSALGDISAFSLAIGLPTLPIMPQVVNEGFRDILGFSMAIDFDFPLASKFKAAAAAAPAAAAPAAAAPAAAAKGAPAKKEKEPEPEPEEEADMGFSLFD